MTNAPPRCEHDVLIINPDMMTIWCSGCRAGVVSSGPRWMPPTVETISVPTETRPRLRRKDKPWSGTPSVLNCVRPVQVMTQVTSQMPRPTGDVVLVPATSRVIPANIVTKYRGTTLGEFPYAFGKLPNITPGEAIDEALNSKFTTTSLDRNFGKEDYTDDGDRIEQTNTAVTSATASPLLNPEREIQKRIEDKRGHEVVKLSKHGLARSWFDGHRLEKVPEDLEMLPPLYEDEALGIRHRADALFHLAVVQCVASFPPDANENGTYNNRLARTIRSHAHEYRPLVGRGGFLTDHETELVCKRLAAITPDQVRRLRERWAELGIFPESSIT